MSKKPVTQMRRWVQNTNETIKRSLSASNTAATRYGDQRWVHPPDALRYGRVQYTLKFLGQCQVEQAKGTDVIRGAIQKIRFGLQLKRSQLGAAGAKMQKVELLINVDALSIVDAKSKAALYRYPLHQISFCADDKQDKRIFAFIAKSADQHHCFVFLSDKLAEEITLTVGEAFDLAYQKFLEHNGRDLELRKQLMQLRQRVGQLEAENNHLKLRLAAYGETATDGAVDGNWQSFERMSLMASERPPLPPATPIPRAPPSAVLADVAANGPAVGRRLENLQLERMDDLFDDSFDPRAAEGRPAAADEFGLAPFGVVNGAGGGDHSDEADFEAAISQLDARLDEMREGFQRGLSFGAGDINANDLLGDLDPLAKSAAHSTPSE